MKMNSWFDSEVCCWEESNVLLKAASDPERIKASLNQKWKPGRVADSAEKRMIDRARETRKPPIYSLGKKVGKLVSDSKDLTTSKVEKPKKKQPDKNLIKLQKRALKGWRRVPSGLESGAARLLEKLTDKMDSGFDFTRDAVADVLDKFVGSGAGEAYKKRIPRVSKTSKISEAELNKISEERKHKDRKLSGDYLRSLYGKDYGTPTDKPQRTTIDLGGGVTMDLDGPRKHFEKVKARLKELDEKNK